MQDSLTLLDRLDNVQGTGTGTWRDRIRTANAREILDSIVIPIRAVMMAVEIQKDRPLTKGEHTAFLRVCATVNQALDTATNQGVINVK